MAAISELKKSVADWKSREREHRTVLEESKRKSKKIDELTQALTAIRDTKENI
jgi:hypothetical protein